VLIAAAGIVLECTQYDAVEPRIDRATLRRQRKPAERQLAGQQLVQHDPQRVDVRTMVHGHWPLDLFWRHVAERAEDLVRRREGDLDRCPAQELCQPEVGDLHAAAAVQQDVLRLDVAVHDPRVVGVLQGVAYLPHDFQCVSRGQVSQCHSRRASLM
jgi:hypothetical protein